MKKRYFASLVSLLFAFCLSAVGQPSSGYSFAPDPGEVIITCPPDTVVNSDPDSCGAWVAVTPATASGSEPIDSIWNSFTGQYSASAFYEFGTTVITWYAVDILGEMDSCGMTVTVYDSIPPTIVCPPDGIVHANSGVCSAIVQPGDPMIYDNCFIEEVWNDYTGTSSATGEYPVGTTVVTWYVTDSSDNIDSCEMTITVLDVQPPHIYCPADIMVDNNPGLCSATIYTTSPMFTDNCGLPVTLTWTLTGATTGIGIGNVGGTSFNVGVTTVTYNVADGSGNTATCSFTVTVLDDEPPSISSPPSLMAICSTDEIPPYATVEEFIYSGGYAGDNCAIDSSSFRWIGDVINNQSCPDTIFRTYMIADLSGNENFCAQLLLINDTITPEIVCPPDTVVDSLSQVPPSYSSTGEFIAHGGQAVDNCELDTTYFDVSEEVFIDTLRTYIMRTYTIADNCGNTSYCQQLVVVNETSFGIPDKDKLRIGIKVYPNPFSGETTFSISLKEPTQVNLIVMDRLGRMVATVVNESLGKGDHRITWDAEGLPSGIYFYRLTANGLTANGKLVVVR